MRKVRNINTPNASLASQYDRQYAWRDFGRALDALEPITGLIAIDLGCGSGTVLGDLCARGAHVTGVDNDADLLAHSARRNLQARHIHASIDTPESWGAGVYDIIWSSFSIAYLPEPADALRAWATRLAPGGRVVLIEAADILRHAPMSREDAAGIEAFERAARGAYAFNAGLHLEAFASAAGLAVLSGFYLRDAELAFQGPASPDVLDAWAARLDRMPRLRAALRRISRTVPGVPGRSQSSQRSPGALRDLGSGKRGSWAFS